MVSRRVVLLIQDESLTRRLLAEALEDEGFALRAASSCDDALGMASTEVVHAAVVDWDLSGGVDGAETLAYLRHRDPLLPVVVLAAVPETTRLAATRLGAAAVLAKESRIRFGLASTLRQVMAAAAQTWAERRPRYLDLIAVHETAADTYRTRAASGVPERPPSGDADPRPATSRQRLAELRGLLRREDERWDWTGE